jgi:hypothetical protein
MRGFAAKDNSKGEFRRSRFGDPSSVHKASISETDHPKNNRFELGCQYACRRKNERLCFANREVDRLKYGIAVLPVLRLGLCNDIAALGDRIAAVLQMDTEFRFHYYVFQLGDNCLPGFVIDCNQLTITDVQIPGEKVGQYCVLKGSGTHSRLFALLKE